MTSSDENNLKNTASKNQDDGSEKKKTLADFTEDELDAMDEEARAELEREARIQAKLERDVQLEELRFGLREVKSRISKMLELQKNMGRYPDADGKTAVSLCISALARHNDEKAIRNALNASLAYLKNHQIREDYELKRAKEDKEREERKKERDKEKKKGLFRR